MKDNMKHPLSKKYVRNLDYSVDLNASGSQELPDVPEEEGTYVLKCVVTSEGSTVSWVLEEE